MVGVMNYSVWIGQLFTSELIHILIELNNLTSHFFLSIHAGDAHGLSIVALTDQASLVRFSHNTKKKLKTRSLARVNCTCLT